MDIKNVIARNIARSGQHLFAIGGGNGSEPFFYTIGNHEKGLPELLVIGKFSPDVMGAMLNHMCDQQRKLGKAFPEGSLDIDWTYPVKMRTCGERAKQEYTIQAGRYYGTEDYAVMQVMLCDRNGQYQDGDNCAFGRVDQP